MGYGNLQPRGYYIDLDGNISTEPANQIPYTLEYKAYLSRFAHEVDMYHREHHDSTNSDFILERFRIIIGRMWQRVVDWDALARDNRGLPEVRNWHYQLPALQAQMEKICLECDEHAYFVRSWTRKADVSGFITHSEAPGHANLDTHDAGYLAGFTNRDTTPWSPDTAHLVSIFGTTESIETSKQPFINSFWDAVDYYDAHEGVRRGE